jgi:uroporphyrinogen III methyltransferase / synthase
MKSKTLFGKRILVTRAKSQAGVLSRLLAQKGAKVIEIPTIEIKPLPLDRRGKEIIQNVHLFNWLVFSSTNAVEIFVKHLTKMGEKKKLRNIKITCVGESTAKALRAKDVKVDLVPKDYRQEGLAKAFQKMEVKEKKFLIAGAKEGRDVLAKFLKRKGAKVELLPLYENRVPRNAKHSLQMLMAQQRKVDLVIFTSSSAADNFYRLFTQGQRRKALLIPTAVIGPVTAATFRKWGGKVVAQPTKYALPALVSEIERWTSRNRRL